MAESVKLNLPLLHMHKARATLSNNEWADLSGLHYNTISRVLRKGTNDNDTISAMVSALNVALQRNGHSPINPIDLLETPGFPEPKDDALILEVA